VPAAGGGRPCAAPRRRCCSRPGRARPEPASAPLGTLCAMRDLGAARAVRRGGQAARGGCARPAARVVSEHGPRSRRGAPPTSAPPNHAHSSPGCSTQRLRATKRLGAGVGSARRRPLPSRPPARARRRHALAPPGNGCAARNPHRVTHNICSTALGQGAVSRRAHGPLAATARARRDSRAAARAPGALAGRPRAHHAIS
jgi:hypothetical protein